MSFPGPKHSDGGPKVNHDLDKPAGISAKGSEAYDILREWARTKGEDYTGGCRAFYSPKEWANRGESYGRDSELVVVHDGGCFSVGVGQSKWMEQTREALLAKGLFVEQCTGWYSAIYRCTPVPMPLTTTTAKTAAEAAPTMDLTEGANRPADHLFDEKALKDARRQVSASRETLVHMHPHEFLGMAQSVVHVPRKANEIKAAIEIGAKLADIPFLMIDKRGDGLFQVGGHEGRHRAKVLAAMGYDSMPVRIIARDGCGIRWGETTLRPERILPEAGGHSDRDAMLFPPIETYPDGPVYGTFRPDGKFMGYSLDVRNRFEKAGAYTSDTSLVIAKNLDLSGCEDFDFLGLEDRFDQIVAEGDVNVSGCKNITRMPGKMEVKGTFTFGGLRDLDLAASLADGFKAAFYSGSEVGSEGHQTINWLGAEDRIRTWSHDFHRLEAGGKTLGDDLSGAHAVVLADHAMKQGVRDLKITQVVGGGNSEASDQQEYLLWSTDPGAEFKELGDAWFEEQLLGGSPQGKPTAENILDDLLAQLDRLMKPGLPSVDATELLEAFSLAKSRRDELNG